MGSPQAIIAVASSSVVVLLGIVAVRAEWNRYGSGGLNAVTFAWAGVIYFVGLGALTASTMGDVARYSIRTSILAFLAVCAGVVGMSLGASSFLATRIADQLPQGPRTLPKKAGYAICISLILIGLTARFLTYGENFLFGSLTKVLPTAWGNYVFDLRHAVVPAGIVGVHILVSHRTRVGEKVLLATLILTCTLFSFLDFSRRPLVLLVIGSLVYWINRKQLGANHLRQKWAYLVVGVMVLFVVAVIAAAVRWLTLQVSGVPLNWSSFERVLRGLTASAVSLDAYSVHLACVSWYQQPDDWLLGGSLAQVVTNPIPRALWPGKPETFGFTIAKLMGEYTTNYGPTIFGEGFANFGVLGSAAFGWLLGFGARLAQHYQRVSRTELSLLLASIVSFEFFAQVRGDMQGITTPMLERAGLFLAVSWTVLASMSRQRQSGVPRQMLTEP